MFRNLTSKRIQVDEIWAFVHCKQKNVAGAKKAPPDAGDVWTWTAIDADTKLIPSWHVGGRDSEAAKTFVDDLAQRLANRIQLTSDGHKVYLEAVEGAFGAEILRHADEALRASARGSQGPLQPGGVHRRSQADD